MKKYVPLIALALSLFLSTGAFAMEVPTNTVVQNLNGSQQVIKTYTIAPGTDPQELVEGPFVLDGYRYTFADIVKQENHVEDVKSHTETVTVETSKDDLDVILEQLDPVIEYDDGLYSGTLSWITPVCTPRLPVIPPEVIRCPRPRPSANWIATICPMSRPQRSRTASR